MTRRIVSNLARTPGGRVRLAVGAAIDVVALALLLTSAAAAVAHG